MNTNLTLKEFNYLKNRTNKLAFEAINDFYKTKAYGLKSCNNKAKELLLYAKTINSFEQDKFNDWQFTNLISNIAVQYIYKQVNKII